MRTRRFLPVALLAILAVVPGCGSSSSSSSGGSGSTPAGARMVRAGTLAFVSVDSDLGSRQWQQLDKLAQKFPGRDKAVSQLKQALSKRGVDYDNDVKPALGPEVDWAFVSSGTSSSTKAVALTKPDDAGAFKKLVVKLNASNSTGNPAVYREVDGWYALSDSQGAITEVLKGDHTALAADPAFKEALGKLPGDALVKAFVNGRRVNALASQAASQGGSGFDSSSLGLDTLKYVAASASVEDNGVRLRGASSGGRLVGGDFASKLVGGVPGDAFALLDFQGRGTTDQLGKLKSNPQLGSMLNGIESALGVSLDQIVALLRGEIAFYARPGAGIPEFTLVLEEKDEGSALATLDKLAVRLAAGSGGRVEPGSQGGHPVKTINLGGFAIHYGGLGGKVVLTSGVSGIADYGGSGDQLRDSADFKEAKDAAGMDVDGGFTYIDLKNALPLLEGFAGLAGHSVPSEVTENLRPLRSFLAWSKGSSSARTFDAFLEIK
jgi:Protein of unknown function (DUF3352)